MLSEGIRVKLLKSELVLNKTLIRIYVDDDSGKDW